MRSLAARLETHFRHFFNLLDGDGRTPGDRVELVGHGGTQIGQNIAAAPKSKVVEGWLAS